MNNRRKWTDEQFKESVKNNESVAGVLREIGLKATGSNYRSVYFFVDKFGLDTSHWTGQGHGKTSGRKCNVFSLNEILVENSCYGGNNAQLKKKLLLADLIENKCYICGCDPIWNNKPLVMILDHINGNHKDNRIENLRMICSNCNSQTKTFAGRNLNGGIRHSKKYFCKNCGKEITSNSKSKLCVKCVKKTESFNKQFENSDKTIYYCKDCGKEIRKKNITQTCDSCNRINRRKVERPSYKDLMAMIKETSKHAVARKYKVEFSTISNWIKQYEKEFKLNNV